jgi:hypothetical protein
MNVIYKGLQKTETKACVFYNASYRHAQQPNINPNEHGFLVNTFLEK